MVEFWMAENERLKARLLDIELANGGLRATVSQLDFEKSQLLKEVRSLQDERIVMFNEVTELRRELATEALECKGFLRTKYGAHEGESFKDFFERIAAAALSQRAEPSEGFQKMRDVLTKIAAFTDNGWIHSMATEALDLAAKEHPTP